MQPLLNFRIVSLATFATLFFASSAARGQIDQQLARVWFDEAAELCTREGGKLWGVSLCGPMVFADPATRELATNQPAPTGERHPALGFANAPLDWGGTRWSAYIWMSRLQNIDAQARRRLWIHELFHRVQGQLNLMAFAGPNDHLDALEGRYWIQLEWRALSRALQTTAGERAEAVADALAFRSTRRALYPDAAANERADEIREGLAQYTGTVVAAASVTEAIADAVRQLAEQEKEATFTRTFAYASGPAYGLLLDAASPGWTARITADDDLGLMLATAMAIAPVEDIAATTERYSGAELRIAEEAHDMERQVRIAELRQRFVEGPVLIVPRGRGVAMNNAGATPIPDAGTVILEYRFTTDWGSFEATRGTLESADGETVRVPLPYSTNGATLSGDGWTITLSPGWSVRPGQRTGDFEIAREE